MSRRRWNQGDVTELPFTPQREQVSHRLEFDAPVEDLVEQLARDQLPWLPPDAIRLPSARGNETFTVWSETETAGMLFAKPALETFWTVTRADADEGHFQVALINPELAVGLLDADITRRDDTTVVRLQLSYTVLSKAGSELFDAGFNERLEAFLRQVGSRLAARSDRDSLRQTRAAFPRRTAEREIIIKANIDECFLLACPVAELDWIDDWHFDLIYSESGRNETGCVFLEPGSGLSMLGLPGAKTYWLTTRFDTERRLFDAVWITRDLTIAHWSVRMTDIGGGEVRVNWGLRYAALGSEGGRVLDNPGVEKRMESGLGFLATALKHYAETGTLYRLSTWRKLRVALSLLSSILFRHWRRARLSRSSA